MVMKMVQIQIVQMIEKETLTTIAHLVVAVVCGTENMYIPTR